MRADAIKAELTDKVTAAVNGELRGGPDGPGGFDHRHGPDDDDTKAELSSPGRAETGPGGHERCERPLRVDTATAEEHLAVASSLDPDWDIAWHGVDVAEQDDDASSVGCADFADGIARFIHECAIVASRPHLPNQPVAGLSLVPRP